LGLLVLTVLIIVVMVLRFEWLGYRASLVARGLMGIEVTQVILGVVFGSGLSYWVDERLRPEISALPEHRSPGESKGSAKADIWWVIVLSTVFVAGVVVPYTSPLFTRLTGLKTPHGEVSFSLPKAEEHIVFQVRREQLVVDTLDYIDTALPRLLANDLDYLELYPNPRKAESARGMRQLLETIIQPLIKCANRAVHEKDDLTSIRSELRPVVEELRRLLQADGEREHDTFRVKVEKSWTAMQNLIAEPSECLGFLPYPSPEESIGDDWPPSYVARMPQLIGGPYPHLMLANLFWFLGDIEVAIDLLRKREKEFQDDMNFNLLLARLLSVQGDDLKDAIQYARTGLKIADDAASRVDFASKRTDTAISSDKLGRMVSRFRTAKQLFKNEIAYW